jgi:hypothetical protein
MFASFYALTRPTTRNAERALARSSARYDMIAGHAAILLCSPDVQQLRKRPFAAFSTRIENAKTLYVQRFTPKTRKDIRTYRGERFCQKNRLNSVLASGTEHRRSFARGAEQFGGGFGLREVVMVMCARRLVGRSAIR